MYDMEGYAEDFAAESDDDPNQAIANTLNEE
jgi:hypothetical protein